MVTNLRDGERYSLNGHVYRQRPGRPPLHLAGCPCWPLRDLAVAHHELHEAVAELRVELHTEVDQAAARIAATRPRRRRWWQP